MFHYAFTAESDGERILKIDQHLVKLWAIKYRFVFLWNTMYIANFEIIPSVLCALYRVEKIYRPIYRRQTQRAMYIHVPSVYSAGMGKDV